MKQITFIAALLVAFSMNAQLLDEGFDDITTLTDYSVINVSDAPNTDIFQGNPNVFPSFDGDEDDYLGMNFNTTSGSVVDLYFITPALDLENGDILTFYTRTGEGSNFPDRLEVRLDLDGSDVAPTSTDNGSYTELLLEINPDLTTGGYPEAWEQQTITIAGLAAEGATTKVAFRYWVTDGGPAGNNSNFIGLDRLVVEEELSLNDLSAFGFNYNVSDGEMRLRANEPLQSIAIYNLLGQSVLDQKLSSTNEVININALTTGVYVAQVTIAGKTESFKIIKR